MITSATPRPVDTIMVCAPPPVVLAYGIGVDSTALLVELDSRGEPPDLVLTADPGAEKPDTYEYQKLIAAWMAARRIPYEVVRYVPQRFKHWPPYYSIWPTCSPMRRSPASALAGIAVLSSGRSRRRTPTSSNGRRPVPRGSEARRSFG